MNASHLGNYEYFTTDGKDLWIVEGYFLEPSITLRRVPDGCKENFGIGGHTAATFKPVILKIEIADEFYDHK